MSTKKTKVNAQDIVKSLNTWMEQEDSKVRFQIKRYKESLPPIYIVLNDKYVESYILNMTSSFFDELRNHIKTRYGIEGITFNNTRSCFWHEDIIIGDA